MAGLADLLLPSPQSIMNQAIGRGPGSPSNPTPLAPGPPPGANAGAPGSGAPPPGAPAPPPQPGGGPPQPGGPAPPPQPPQPQAYQTPPDMGAMNAQLSDPSGLMKLYMQLSQRQQQAESINRGVGLMLAGLANPRDRATMIGASEGMSGPDPGSIMNSMMGLSNFSLQQQQRAALMRSIPDLAEKLNMTPDEIMASGPEGIQELMRIRTQAQLPTDAIRTYTQARAVMKAQGMSDAEINAQLPIEGVIAGASGMGPDYGRFLVERSQATANLKPGETIDPRYSSFTNWQSTIQAEALGKKEAETGQRIAQRDLGSYNGVLNDMKGKTQEILDAKPEDLQAIANAGVIGRGLATSALPSLSGLAPEQQNLVRDIAELSKYDLKGFGQANPGRGSDIATIQNNLSPVFDRFSVGPDQVRDAATALKKSLLGAQGNAWGAAGMEAPDDVKPFVDPQYLPGGKSFSGVAKPLSPDMIAKAQQAINEAEKQAPGQGRNAIIQHLKAQFYDTSPLGG